MAHFVCNLHNIIAYNYNLQGGRWPECVLPEVLHTRISLGMAVNNKSVQRSRPE